MRRLSPAAPARLSLACRKVSRAALAALASAGVRVASRREAAASVSPNVSARRAPALGMAGSVSRSSSCTVADTIVLISVAVLTRRSAAARRVSTASIVASTAAR